MLDNLFLSVGAMKAGTTWLYQQLKDHPDVYFTPEKEIHYFANKVGIENQLSHKNRVLKLKEIMQIHVNGNAKYLSSYLDEIYWYSNFSKPKDIDNDWYESLFEGNDKKYCADFSNLYCQMNDSGWNNVKSVARNTKVIYTLRDPFDRVWSHYKFHMKWVNREDDVLDAGFKEFKELLDKRFFWVNAEYADNYERLADNISKENLMVLYFEDFRSHPEKMLNEINEFLGIRKQESTENSLTRKVNATKSFEIPEDWRDYLMEKLEPEKQKMKSIGLWSDKWKD